MGEQERRVAAPHAQSQAHITRTTLVDMRLQEQPLHFAALVILLLFNAVQGRGLGQWGGQPGFEFVELRNRAETISHLKA